MVESVAKFFKDFIISINVNPSLLSQLNLTFESIYKMNLIFKDNVNLLNDRLNYESKLLNIFLKLKVSLLNSRSKITNMKKSKSN